jgi:hypothetical protein
MFVFLNNPSIDQLESIRELLNELLTVATLAVFVGVYFEQDGHPEDVRKWGWQCVAKGVALELFCGLLLWQVDSSIGYKNDIQIEALRLANSKLEAEIQPRRLTADDIAALKAAATRFPNRAISIWSYGIDQEARVLASQILSALNDASAMTVDSIGHMISSTTPRIGIIITGPDDELIEALLAALKPLSPTRGSLNNPGSYSKSGVAMSYGGTSIVPAEIFVGIKPINP